MGEERGERLGFFFGVLFFFEFFFGGAFWGLWFRERMERRLESEKFQVYDVVPPTHVSHNIMKQRLGEDGTACCYSDIFSKRECKKQNEKLRKNEN